ncbi:hypothetical protein MKW98_016992 [Papaver atlanticum]|uniref:Uncharacterized protein n=1 Tax=Papaver atlanticum TaxID=357466 RepID=A0AAD4TH50_9MAGN|nr:hypothetical protein MKW98_016992 [Papaver atlanticum]
MASKKIHLFRQSAGNPGKYYINPSEKLMSMASEWRVVEHEDGIEMIFNRAAFKGIVIFGTYYNNQAIGDSENMDDDYRVYGYIMNTDFLDVKKIKCEVQDVVTETYIPKIKGDEITKKKNKSKKKKKVVGVQAE